MVIVIAAGNSKYLELLEPCPGTARAEVLGMAITSVPEVKSIANLSDARNSATCATCSSAVDLTASLLMRGGRIVGCPSCDWGDARARATRAVDRGAPLRALA